jgi:glycosyltransferase involved in cell wall biosynthesis
MRILFVAPWVPSPVRPRSLAFLRMLSAEHEVRFLALVRHTEEARLAQQLPTPHHRLVPNGRAGSALRCVRALCTGRPLQQGYASPPGFTAALHRELDTWQPEAVHLNVFRTAHLVEQCAPTPVLIDLDEFRSDYYRQLATDGPSLTWRSLGRIEAGRMRAREDELVRAGVPILLSAPLPPDQQRPNTYVVRSPCDLPLLRTGWPARPTVLFVGRLTYEANVHGLQWFVRECWPEIRRTVPGARLRVVGATPARLARSLSAADIEVHPNVPAVEPYYENATLAIAPIFRGTGIQMKVIQALAAGVPTITTSTVAERAGLRDGVQVRVADAAPAWVEATRDLLRDPGAATRMAAAGREWAVAEHAPAAVRRQLDAAYAALLGPSSPPPSRRASPPPGQARRWPAGSPADPA